MRADRARWASMPPVYSESEASTKWRAVTGGVSEHLTIKELNQNSAFGMPLIIADINKNKGIDQKDLISNSSSGAIAVIALCNTGKYDEIKLDYYYVARDILAESCREVKRINKKDKNNLDYKKDWIKDRLPNFELSGDTIGFVYPHLDNKIEYNINGRMEIYN